MHAKNRNIAKLSRIICCVGGSDSKKAEPKPASLLEGLALASACVVAVTDADGNSSACMSLLTRGSLITVSSSSYDDDDGTLPSSMSSCSIRGDNVRIVGVCWFTGLSLLLLLFFYGSFSKALQIKGNGIWRARDPTI